MGLKKCFVHKVPVSPSVLRTLLVYASVLGWVLKVFPFIPSGVLLWAVLHGQHMYWWGIHVSSSNISYLKIATDWKWRLRWNWFLRSPFTIPRWLTAKEYACQCRRCKRWGLIPGSGRSPGVENGNPLQYTCLGNSMDREGILVYCSPWGRKESDMRVRARAHTHTHTLCCTTIWYLCQLLFLYEYWCWLYFLEEKWR